MKILAIEHELPGVTSADFTPELTKAEAARAWELYQAGAFRELYFCRDHPSAVLMLECADMAEAEEILSTLPLVKASLITFELMPLIPYPGFARLFGEEIP
jgi:muconolactone delta-isomerase